MEKIIAIIPARSGSKGLKDKNIRSMNGKPLISYTIEAAKKSGIFHTIFVSTDSEEYASISRAYGAFVPFLRSDELSNDTATSKSVIFDVLEKLKEKNLEFDSFMLLQPTSPLRTYNDIIESHKLFVEKKANAVVSICEVDHNPMFSNILPEDSSLDNFIKKNNLRRQELPIYYRINGAIYLCNIDYYLLHGDFYNDKSFAYIMSKMNSIDIDDKYDFKIAEFLMKEKSIES